MRSSANNFQISQILALPGSRNVTGWSISDIVGMMTQETLDWVSAHNLQEKSVDELHALLLQGRRELNLLPWDPFTALMQAYAGAAAMAEGIPERLSSMSDATYKRCAWFVSARSLDMFRHKFTETYKVAVRDEKTGDMKDIAWYIGKVDGNEVFASWSLATERLLNNLTNTYLLDPDTLEPVATSAKLAKWTGNRNADDVIVMPMHHLVHRKSRRTKQAKKEEQMELPLAAPTPEPVQPVLTDERCNVRKLIIGMFKAVCNPANMCDDLYDDKSVSKPTWTQEMQDARMAPLSAMLWNTLDEYEKTLSDASVNEHIPEKIIVTCGTISELMPGKLAALSGKWLEDLQETAVKRA